MEKQGLGFKRELEMGIYYDGIDIGTRRINFFVEDQNYGRVESIS